MANFCFAAYANTILNLKALKKSTNKKTVDLLLGLILDNQEALGISILNRNGMPYIITDKIASELLSGISDVHQEIKNAAADQKIIDNADLYFEDIVMPEFKPSLLDDLIASIRTLIISDLSISKNKKDELTALSASSKPSIFLSQTFLYALQKPFKAVNITMETAEEFMPSQADIDILETIIKKIPSPPTISVLNKTTEDELPYICALLEAYAEAMGLTSLPKTELQLYPTYQDDLIQRRIEYYAAETIRNGIRDCFPPSSSDEFEILKSETHSAIFDTCKRTYANGFDKLLSVMEKATTVTINRCIILSRNNWVGNNEKKGVCHILVNDGKIKWTAKND